MQLLHIFLRGGIRGTQALRFLELLHELIGHFDVHLREGLELVSCERHVARLDADAGEVEPQKRRVRGQRGRPPGVLLSVQAETDAATVVAVVAVGRALAAARRAAAPREAVPGPAAEDADVTVIYSFMIFLDCNIYLYVKNLYK